MSVSGWPDKERDARREKNIKNKKKEKKGRKKERISLFVSFVFHSFAHCFFHSFFVSLSFPNDPQSVPLESRNFDLKPQNPSNFLGPCGKISLGGELPSIRSAADAK